MLRRSPRWYEPDDRRLTKRSGPSPDVNPIEELIRIVGDG